MSRTKTINFTMIRTSDVVSNPKHVRKTFDKDKMQEMTGSVKEHDVMQPLILRPRGNKYQIVAGERRLRAARAAGISEIPAVIKDVSDTESLLLSFVENVRRDDLTSVEREDAMYELWQSGEFGKPDEHGTITKLAKATGYDHSTVIGLINAKKLRSKLLVSNNLPTGWLVAAASKIKTDKNPDGIEPTVVAKILNEVHEKQQTGEIGSGANSPALTDVRGALDVMANASPAVKRAYIKGEIDVDDARNAMHTIKKVKKEDIDLPPEREDDYVRHVVQRKAGRQYQRQLEEKVDRSILKGTTHVVSPKSSAQKVEEGDRDIAMQHYHYLVNELHNMLGALKVDMGRTSARNDWNEKHWVQIWTNVAKHVSTHDELEQIVYDYIDVISKRLATLRQIFDHEITQRKRDLR